MLSLSQPSLPSSLPPLSSVLDATPDMVLSIKDAGATATSPDTLRLRVQLGVEDDVAFVYLHTHTGALMDEWVAAFKLVSSNNCPFVA